MTLFIDLSGDENQTFTDLYSISSHDGGLGEDEIGADQTIDQVSYLETPGSPATADLLNTLVNTDFGTPIIITALAGGIDPHSGKDVTGNAFTYLESSGTAPVIRIVYDDSQCNGAGTWGLDVNNNHIATPNSCLLYHELSHAYRRAARMPDNEQLAIGDENVMRAELGQCLRDVDNHNGGCGPGNTCGGRNNGCFIVSAATGSAESLEVVRLKQLRDRVVRSTRLGAQLLDAIYRDYYRFSPRLAIELHRNNELREGVLNFAVRPLIAWYFLAETLSLDPDDTDSRQSRCDAACRTCLITVDPAVVGEAMTAIKTGQRLPRNSPSTLSYLAERTQEMPSLQFASWAILEPLAQLWTSVANKSDPCEQVHAWLTATPLEALNPSQQDLLELAKLVGGGSSRKAERSREGRPPATAWPEALGGLPHHDDRTRYNVTGNVAMESIPSKPPGDPVGLPSDRS